MPNYKQVLNTSPDFDKACLDCARPNAYSSQWAIYGLSCATSMNIEVIYPPMNGFDELGYKVLNTLCTPQNETDKTVCIMWSSCLGVRRTKRTWIADHFVPIISQPPKHQSSPKLPPGRKHQNRGASEGHMSNRAASNFSFSSSSDSSDNSPTAKRPKVGKNVKPQNSAPSKGRVPGKQSDVEDSDESNCASPNFSFSSSSDSSDNSPTAKRPKVGKNVKPQNSAPSKGRVPGKQSDVEDSDESNCASPNFSFSSSSDSSDNSPTAKRPKVGKNVKPQNSAPSKRHVSGKQSDIEDSDESNRAASCSLFGSSSDSGDNSSSVKRRRKGKRGKRRNRVPSQVPASEIESEGSESVTSQELDNEDNAVLENSFKHLPGGRLMTVSEIYSQIHHKDDVHTEVPQGVKNNVYFLVQNETNIQKRSDGQRSNFYDDCGAWESQKAMSAKTTHIVSERLKQVTLKNDQYCIKQKRQGRITWVPLNPQPDECDIVILHKYYASLKKDNRYKKRVSWFESTTNTEISNTALYEYSGLYPMEAGDDSFVRTNPKVLNDIEAAIDNKKRPQEIYTDCLKNDDSFNMPRNTKQIRNLKYRKERREREQTHHQNNNVADEILEVIAMLNDHPFVQEIIHSKEMVPSIICYTEEQMLDLKHFVQNKSGRLGIDRTFNLGVYFVTTFVYKSKRVIVRETKNNPLILGPIFLHKDASYRTYRSFFAHIAAELEVNLINVIDVRLSKEIQLGSDDEKALTKAVDATFPDSKRLLCARHLKDNVRHYLRDIACADKEERKDIMKKLFAEDGLVCAKDDYTFEKLAMDVFELSVNNRKFSDYFMKHLKPRMRDHVYDPSRGKENPWTNNNTESMNNVIKTAVNWRPRRAADLVEKLHNITYLQFEDMKRALYGSGNYSLAEPFHVYRISRMHWRNKGETPKKNHLQELP